MSLKQDKVWQTLSNQPKKAGFRPLKTKMLQTLAAIESHKLKGKIFPNSRRINYNDIWTKKSQKKHGNQAYNSA